MISFGTAKLEDITNHALINSYKIAVRFDKIRIKWKYLERKFQNNPITQENVSVDTIRKEKHLSQF